MSTTCPVPMKCGPDVPRIAHVRVGKRYGDHISELVALAGQNCQNLSLS